MFYNISTVNKLSDVVTEIGVLNKENEGLTIELDDIPPIYAKPYFPNIKFEVEIAGLVSQVNASFKIRCSKSKLHTGCPKRKGISVQYISCFYQARNSILTVMPWLICWLSFPCLWAFIIQAYKNRTFLGHHVYPKSKVTLFKSYFSKINFKLRKLETRYRVTFHMIDTERNCDRKLGENNMLFTGDKIEAFTDEAKMKFYMAELKY